MASPRRIKLLCPGTGLLSAVLLSASPAAFPQEKEVQASAEERLLQAELQEASAADLARAAGAYRSLASDEKAPAAVRARAWHGSMHSSGEPRGPGSRSSAAT